MRQNANVLLSERAERSEAVAATSSRLAKIEVLAKALHDAGPAEVTIAVAYLSGELPQRQIGVGWATLREACPPGVRWGQEGRWWTSCSAGPPPVSSRSCSGCCPGRCTRARWRVRWPRP